MNIAKALSKFNALPKPVRAGLVLLSSVDGAGRFAAVKDAIKRPADEIRGPKLLWIILLAVVNSGGILPLVYKRFAVQD